MSIVWSINDNDIYLMIIFFSIKPRLTECSSHRARKYWIIYLFYVIVFYLYMYKQIQLFYFDWFLYVSDVAWCCLREIAYVHIVKWKFKILHKHTNTITRVTYIGMHIASCSYHTNTHCHIISHCKHAEKKRKKQQQQIITDIWLSLTKHFS